MQKINPVNTPTVVGALIDAGCNEDYIKVGNNSLLLPSVAFSRSAQNLLMSVRSLCPVETLVEQVEKRNRLKLILPWLEARVAEGAQEPG